MNAVAYGNGLYVAVGLADARGNNVFLTADGVSWSFATCPTTNELRGITFGAGQFVAVGDLGTLFTSADGVSWSQRTSGTSNQLSGVAYGANQFVCVGGKYVYLASIVTVVTSVDGVNWTTRNYTNSGDGLGRLNDVAYGSGVWVAVGSPQYDKAPILVSSNAIDWVNKPITVAPYMELRGVTYGDSGFVAVGDGQGNVNQNALAYSADGANWIRTAIPNSPNFYLRDVSYGNGRYVSVSYERGYIATTTNGIDWTQAQRLSASGRFLGMAASPSGFLACGMKGASADSTNGFDWETHLPISDLVLTGLIHANGKFTAVGFDVSNYGLSVIGESKDGEVWKFINRPNLFWDVVYANGMYVAVGGTLDYGNIQISSDGLNWTNRDQGLGVYSAVTVGPPGFVAVGRVALTAPSSAQAAVALSTDGIAWTFPNPGLTNDSTYSRYLKGVAFGVGNYVAVGDSGAIVTSADGSNWIRRNSGTSTNSLFDIIYANGFFTAVGSGGMIRTSPTGTNWTTVPTDFSDSLWAITYGNGTFVAVGMNGVLALSTNALNWTKTHSGANVPWLRDVAYGDGTFVVVGSSGTILQSRDFRPSLSGNMTVDAFEVLAVGGEVDATYRLEASSDPAFSFPSSLSVYSNTGVPIALRDTNAPSFPQRFYRLISP